MNDSSEKVVMYGFVGSSPRGLRKGMLLDLEYMSSDRTSSDKDGWSPGVLKMSADWLRPIPLKGGDWSAMTGSPLMKDKGVLLVPIIAAGSTERKELEYGVLKTFCGRASLVGPEWKKAGVPKSLGEFRVVADIGPPNCRKSIP